MSLRYKFESCVSVVLDIFKIVNNVFNQIKNPAMTWRGGGKQTNGYPKNIFLSMAHFYPRWGAIMDSNLSHHTTPRTFWQPKKICYTKLQ